MNRMKKKKEHPKSDLMMLVKSGRSFSSKAEHLSGALSDNRQKMW